MRLDQKTHFLKNANLDKKLVHFKFWLVWLKTAVLRAKIGIWL
jgi:hypothetical protein